MLTASGTKKIIGFILLLLLSSPANAWTQEDSMWQSAYLAAHVADWGQTRDIAAQCRTSGAYQESNIVLGSCPSIQMVNAYFVATALLHTGVAHALPSKYRRMFQVGTLGLQLNVVNSNTEIGLQVNF
ncbi:MAG: hypothetical protein OEW58_10865 [Gammaproteobacteria bacterium]|nr:hypothetical protein [Gammaproteobacteria bacterium]